MMHKFFSLFSLLSLVSLLLISGCSQEGGSCRYTEFEETHQIDAIDSNTMTFKNDTFPPISTNWLPQDYNTGDYVKIKGARIVEGSCNPLQIKAVTLVSTDFR